MPTPLVRDLMTTRVISVHEDTPFRGIIERLRFWDVSGVPVVDGDGYLVGIVTEGDLLPKETSSARRRPKSLTILARLFGGRRGRSLGKAEGRTARDLMTPDPVTTSPDEPIRTAARRMARKGVKRLPVTENGKVVGVLSRQDVLHVFDRPDGALQGAVEERLREWLLMPPHRDVRVRVEDGLVFLQGTVQFEGDVRVAERIAGGTDGAIAVENELVFKTPDIQMPLP